MIRLALRNVARNRWRTGLTVVGVAVAVAALVWSNVMIEALVDTLVRRVAAVQVGELRVESEARARDGALQDAFPATAALLGRVRAVAGVRAVAPRLTTFGLLAREARSQAAVVVGVAADAEAAASEVAGSVVAGAWLSSGADLGAGASPARPAPPAPAGGREVVLGEDLAALLSARVGDEVVLMLQAADGATADDRLRVVGLARTGTELDRRGAWMQLADVGWLAALDGEAHALMVRVERGASVQAVAGGVRAAIAGAGGPRLVARTWEELVPDVRQLIAITHVTMGVLYAIVGFVAALGILNAQRMTALERRRELGVMMAVGVTPVRLAGLLMVETAALMAAGVSAGALAGWAASAWHAHAGLDLGGLGSEGFSYGGAFIPLRLYGVVRAPLVAAPAAAVLALGSLCGAWPAVASARLELVRALSGRS